MSESPVLVVGAGPTGLVLAIELARRGVPFQLIERRPEPLGRDRAVCVKSRTLEVFDGMGLADRFVRQGRMIRALDLFSGGTKVGSIGLGGLDSPFPFDLCIPEEQTEALLTERLEQLGGRLERGVELIGLEQAARSVHARLRSLQDGERALEASWVIGTDGIHSAVREAIGDEFDGHDYPARWGVVEGRLAGWRRPHDHATVQIEPPIAIAFPLHGGRWRFTFRSQSESDDILATVATRIAATSPGVTLQDADQPELFHTHARVARHYRSGRVLVAGDAAHASTPFEGHGMNTGIHDAYNLGWKLALVASGAAPETLLNSYEAERRPVAQAINRSGDDAEARGAGLGPAELAKAEVRKLAALAEAEIAFAYDQSPIVDDIAPPGQTQDVKAGCRLGDASSLEVRDRTCRLYELIGVPGHSLFVLLGEADEGAVTEGLALASAAARRYRPHLQAFVVTRNPVAVENASSELLRDPTGALHERLGARRPSLCLVRPDGHLGLRAEPPSLGVLEGHLRRILLA